MSHTRLLNGCPFIYLGAMRALLFAALLVLVSGCHKNHELFRSYQDELDRRLSAMKLRADHFNETRKAVDALEREVTQGLVELPAAREQLAGLEDLPTTASPLAPLPPLPPGSVFEGPDGERLRLRIAETERRIAELTKLLAELDAFEARKKTLERKMTLLRAMRK